MLGYKVSLTKYKKIEIVSSKLSDAVMPEINYKEKKTCKKHKYMEAKHYATKQPMVH